MFLESSPELLVLLLQGADVSVFLLNAENKMGAWPVMCDFVKVLHVFLILPHSVHLLQHLLRPNLEINTEANRHQLIKIAPLRVKAVIVGKIILKAAVEVKIL